MRNIVEIKIRYNQKATEGEPVEYVSLYEVWQKSGYSMPHHRWAKQVINKYKIKAQSKVIKTRTPGRNVVAYYIPLDKFEPIQRQVELRMNVDLVLKREEDEPLKEIEIYMSEELGKIGAIILEGNMWFIASSILKIMKFEKTAITLVAPDRVQNITGNLLGLETDKPVKLINEAGLYDLIFHAKGPHGQAVQDWILSEVLTDLRKQVY